MTFDLVVKPDDWFLGLWWGECPPGDGGFYPHDLYPNGGQRFALARRLAVGNNGHPSAWVIEECTREVGGTWRKRQRIETHEAGELVTWMERRHRLIPDAAGWTTCSVAINGGAADAARILGFAGLLPAWLSVLVIEHKPAAVPEPS